MTIFLVFNERQGSSVLKYLLNICLSTMIFRCIINNIGKVLHNRTENMCCLDEIELHLHYKNYNTRASSWNWSIEPSMLTTAESFMYCAHKRYFQMSIIVQLFLQIDPCEIRLRPVEFSRGDYFSGTNVIVQLMCSFYRENATSSQD